MKIFQKYKLISIAILLLSTSVANATISLGFGTPINSGNTLDVDVLISGLGSSAAPSLGSYDLDILFDDIHLSFASATFGSELDLFGFGTNFLDASLVGPGKVNIYEISLDTEIDLNNFQADSFTLATLTFDVLQSNSSQLSLLVNELSDAAAISLSASLTSHHSNHRSCSFRILVVAKWSRCSL